MKSKKVFVVLLIIFLVACNGQVPTAAPLFATPVANTAKETVLSQTPTMQPTNTSVPIFSQAAEIPSATQTALPFLDQYLQVCEGAIHPSFQDNALSKNGEWLAIVCDLKFNNRTSTKVFRLNGTQSWEVPFYETAGMYLKSESFPEGFEGGVMEPFHWTKDGNYLYLAPQILYLDGPWLEFVNGFGLYRLNLNTGRVSLTLRSNVYAFSPNDRYLASISSNGNLEILDLFTGKITAKSIKPFSLGLGYLMWVPDSEKLTFIEALDLLWDQNGQFTLYLYDFANNNLGVLLTKDSRSCVVKEWASKDEVLLIGATNANSCQLIYDVSAKTFTPVFIPTP